MKEKANPHFNRRVSADVSVSYGCDCGHCEVERSDVELRDVKVSVFANFYPSVLIVAFIVKVSCYEDP